MDLKLQGKKVLVTGGSKGIGKAIAKAFVDEGAVVAISARNLDDLRRAKEELGGNVSIYQADVTVKEERENLISSFIKDHGAIDVLINNAGGSNGGKAMETDMELFHAAMELNYFSAVHLSKLAAGHMKKAGKGSIVNITSLY